MARFAAVVTLWVCVAGAAQADRQVLFGLMHAHTAYSDGSGTPQEAFAMAKGAGLQFFAVTEHNHAQAEQGAKDRRDGVLIANQHELYNGQGQVTVAPTSGSPYTAVSLVRAAQIEATPAFIPLYGQEFSTISAGNHVNVFEYANVLEVPNGDFAGLFRLIKADGGNSAARTLVQLNHPNYRRDHGFQSEDLNKRLNDYGLDDYGGDYAQLVAATSGNVRLIEMLSGPALSPNSDPDYRYHAHEEDYYFYLTQGLLVSPSVGQDNHYKTWGTITDARMGVQVSAFTKAGLLEALMSNRTYATEDKDLRLGFQINGQPMGSRITVARDKPLIVRVDVADPTDTDADLSLELVHGLINSTKSDAAVKTEADDGVIESRTIRTNGNVEIAGLVATGDPEFFYVRIVQKDKDRAWSAPIWVNYAESKPAPPIAGEVFAWTSSTSSKVYHASWCIAVKQIKQENLVTGAVAPQGRKLHKCQRAQMDEEEHQ